MRRDSIIKLIQFLELLLTYENVPDLEINFEETVEVTAGIIARMKIKEFWF